MITTSRRQGQSREGLFGGSPSAKLQADGQKLDRRPSLRVELAPDNEDHWFARYGKSGSCAATVHVLIWGGLLNERSVMEPVRPLVDQAWAQPLPSTAASE